MMRNLLLSCAIAVLCFGCKPAPFVAVAQSEKDHTSSRLKLGEHVYNLLEFRAGEDEISVEGVGDFKTTPICDELLTAIESGERSELVKVARISPEKFSSKTIDGVFEPFIDRLALRERLVNTGFEALEWTHLEGREASELYFAYALSSKRYASDGSGYLEAAGGTHIGTSDFRPFNPDLVPYADLPVYKAENGYFLVKERAEKFEKLQDSYRGYFFAPYFGTDLDYSVRALHGFYPSTAVMLNSGSFSNSIAQYENERDGIIYSIQIDEHNVGHVDLPREFITVGYIHVVAFESKVGPTEGIRPIDPDYGRALGQRTESGPFVNKNECSILISMHRAAVFQEVAE